MAKVKYIEGDMSDEIAELRREIAEIRISKELNAKEKRSALRVYEAMIETAKSVRRLNMTANRTIATCERVVKKCERIRRSKNEKQDQRRI